MITAAYAGDKICEIWMQQGDRMTLSAPSGIKICVPKPTEVDAIIGYISVGHNMDNAYEMVANSPAFSTSPTVRTCHPPAELAYCVEGIYKTRGRDGGRRIVDNTICTDFYNCLAEVDAGLYYTHVKRAMMADGVFVPSEAEKACIVNYVMSIKADLQEAYSHCCLGNVNIFPWWPEAEDFILTGIINTRDDLYNLIKMSYNAYVAGKVINPLKEEPPDDETPTDGTPANGDQAADGTPANGDQAALGSNTLWYIAAGVVAGLLLMGRGK